MIIFWAILVILFFIILLFFLLCISNLEIKIENLTIDTRKKTNKKIGKYLIIIYIKLLNKIPIFRLKIYNKRVEKFQNIKINMIKTSIIKDKKLNISDIKNLNILVKNLNLYIEVCAINAFITSYMVAIIASIISIVLAKNIKRYSKEQYNYNIIPIYNYKSYLKIKLSSIINIKVVDIFNLIYKLTKKIEATNIKYKYSKVDNY